jgi:hypothetical protein
MSHSPAKSANEPPLDEPPEDPPLLPLELPAFVLPVELPEAEPVEPPVELDVEPDVEPEAVPEVPEPELPPDVGEGRHSPSRPQANWGGQFPSGQGKRSGCAGVVSRQAPRAMSATRVSGAARLTK